MFASCLRPFAARLRLALVLAASLAAIVTASGQRFYADDPLAKEPETQDASGVKPGDLGLVFDMSWNLFVTPGLKRSNVHAQNVNTIDEVPDSSWFTNRILPGGLPVDNLVRGPNVGPPPNPEEWIFIREKSAGYAPGFTARDANGETWFLSFDPPGNPEGASAAMVVASKIFWVLGYNQVETFITTIDPKRVRIDPTATIKRPNGKRTPATRDDLNAVFERAARNADGTYRAAAGRLIPGKPLGPFRYEGTRPDDPNDIYDHQHRRELRALRVFGAWTNLTDLKAGNTLDTLVTVNGRSLVRHYLQDVGSTFGIGANGPHDWDEGFEYFYEAHSSRKRLMTLGFALSPWQTADYTLYPSVGRFESEAFNPVTWRPHAPTTAYMEMLADDAFWAARRVAAFDDDLIRALVHTGQFSDPKAEAHLAAILIQRRDKVARAYLPAINPIVNAALDLDGALRFENAATAAGVADAPAGYHAGWWLFDNNAGRTELLAEVSSTRAAIKAPDGLPSTVGSLVEVDVTCEGSRNPGWERPVRLFFRRGPEGWKLVGLERDLGLAPLPASRVADGR